MRTTLNLDDDLWQFARQRAKQHGQTVGQVVCELARRGLASGKTRNGIELLTPVPKGKRPDLRLVSLLRDLE